MRRRAEARLWQEKSDAATVHAFTGDQPTTAKGRFALARFCSPRAIATAPQRLVREAWRSEELTERTEADALDAFRDLLTREDHRARMDKRIGAKDFAGAMRAAQRLGDDELAIVKACGAVRGQSDKALDQLDAVATEARQDLGYALCRIQWMMRQNKIDDAARVMMAAAPETMAQQDTDEWWRERRMLARKLLDLGKFQTAYEVVRAAALPANENYRADSISCPAGSRCAISTIPRRRARISPMIDEGVDQSDRAGAGELLARPRRRSARRQRRDARRAMKPPRATRTAYYGQLARAKLGIDGIELRAPPQPLLAASDAPSADERVRAADMLYAIGERDVVLYFAADLAEQMHRRRRARSARRTHRPPQRCARHAADRQDRARRAALRSTTTPSRPSASRSTARSVPKSSAASSIRSRAPKARSTSATTRRPMRSA